MMTKEIKELQRIRSILSYLTGFEDDDQENIEDAFKSVGRVIDSLAEQSAQQKPDINHELTIAYMAGVERGKELAQHTWVGLTLEEIDTEWGLFMSGQGSGYIPDFVRAIEAKLRSKNEDRN